MKKGKASLLSSLIFYILYLGKYPLREILATCARFALYEQIGLTASQVLLIYEKVSMNNFIKVKFP